MEEWIQEIADLRLQALKKFAYTLLLIKCTTKILQNVNVTGGYLKMFSTAQEVLISLLGLKNYLSRETFPLKYTMF